MITWLTATERLPEDKMGYGVMIVTAMAAAAGSVVTIRRVKHFALVMSVCFGFLYFIILLAINAVFFGAQYQGIGATALLVLGSGVSVALIGNMNRIKYNSYQRKRRNG